VNLPHIVIHPSVTMRKYHEGDDAPPYAWTAECAFDELKKRLPDTSVHLLSPQEAAKGDLSQTRVLLAGIVSAALLDRMPHLQWIQFPGSGADHFFKASRLSPEDFSSRGIRVLNCPGISKYPVAEHALAMLLALGRGIPRAIRQQTSRTWHIFPANEVRGKTLGIIGLGSIGERVARYARALDMWVVGSKRDPHRHEGNAHVVLPAAANDTITRSADFLILLTPLSDATRGRFDYAMFRAMKPSAYFINLSRGENVVEKDLVRALKEGVIAGAAIDTFGPLSFDDPKKLEALSPDSDLWELPNVLIMPNNAASTEHYMYYFAESVADNYIRARLGEPFRSAVA
jgi:phosphoglycerate dehydrogenase-like enzyme